MSTSSAYGRHLYDLLPEIYRERDRNEPQSDPLHLQRYLDSHGVLLDRVRATLEQMYADHFPDVPDAGRPCQAWIVPYLADLVGAVPVSPFADGQRDEVANAIRWSKRRGTLVVIEEIVETVALSEAEIQEGWKRVIVTARPDDTILPATFYGRAPHPIDDVLANPDQSTPYTTVNPRRASHHRGLRIATLDMRMGSRAVQAPIGEMGVEASRFNSALRLWPRDDNAKAEKPSAPIGWRQHEPHGVPCFPGSYEDVSPRTVDMRTPDPMGTVGRYHPKSVIVYLPPPFGLCPPAPTAIAWPSASQWAGHEHLERIDPSPLHPGVIVVRNKTAGSVLIQGDLSIGPAGGIALPAGVTLRLEKLRFDGKLSLSEGAVELERCAVREFAFADGGAKSLKARSVLFGAVTGDGAKAELEYCTILERVTGTAQLNASEVIFPDDTPADSIVCARYSRLPPGILNPNIERLGPKTNTGTPPIFVSKDFCTPGAGVLKPETGRALLEGAEDGTEIGAYHDWRYAVLRTAVARKLGDYLPLGMRPVIAWDARLLKTPPTLKNS